MSDEANDVVMDLLTLDVTGFGPDWIRTARILQEAVDAIKSLRAEVERLGPKAMGASHE